jgi:hypothetical protein
METSAYVYEIILEFERQIFDGPAVKTLIMFANSDSDATGKVKDHLGTLKVVSQYDGSASVVVRAARTEIQNFAGSFVYDPDLLLTNASTVYPDTTLTLSQLVR